MFYKLNRLGTLHRIIRNSANSLLWRLPDALKYNIGMKLRRHRLPYSLISSGDTVIQIGAPWDLLKAGRSRAVYFAMLAGEKGRVIVVEPDPDNVAALNEFRTRRGLEQMLIVDKGAWSKKDRLRFLINPEHPASNLVESVYDQGRHDLSAYNAIEIEVESLDDIVAAYGVKDVRLVSITSNGSERQILEGMAEIQKSTTYVATVGRPEKYSIVEDYGFTLLGEDDRGYLFGRSQVA